MQLAGARAAAGAAAAAGAGGGVEEARVAVGLAASLHSQQLIAAGRGVTPTRPHIIRCREKAREREREAELVQLLIEFGHLATGQSGESFRFA